MKKVILTGGTSMLGISFINECIKNNTQVIAIVREGCSKKKLLPVSKLVNIYECNLDKLKHFSIDEYNFDAFYHFAWENTDKINRSNPKLQIQNIKTTLYAVNLAYRQKCKKFIGVGSQAEYGQYSYAISPDFSVNPNSAYGIAKYSAGKFSSIQCNNLGIDFIWTRVFSVYGINDNKATMIMYCIDSLMKGETPQLTKCEQFWDYLYCEDAANAFYLIGKNGKNQSIYNIGSGLATPLSEYVLKMRDAIDTNLEVVMGKKNYPNDQIMYLCADISNLISDTGFTPKTSFEIGIRKTIEWYKKVRNEY